MNESDKLFMETAEKQQKIIDTLLEACKQAYRCLSMDSDMEEDFAPEIKQLQKAIDITENK